MLHTLSIAISLASAHAAEWVYANPGATAADTAAQEATWGGLCTTGREQSPINVVTTETVHAPLPLIETFIDADVTFVKNTGHGFQVFETSPLYHNISRTGDGVEVSDMQIDSIAGSSKGYSLIGDDKFNFYQVHWHTPSENTIDGKSFPLEAHFVHQFDDKALVGTLHRLAVIGIMYELGECNPLLDKFWADFPATSGVSEYKGEDIDFNAKLAEELTHGYWHWYGSLTTPPCTESVSWNLLKKTETVCERQVRRLEAALAQTQNGIAFNNRVPQPLNHRVVVDNFGLAPSPPPPPLPPPTAKWYYAADGADIADARIQAESWGKVALLCNEGREQSPINIVTANTVSAPLPSIVTNFDTTAEYVKNTGHGFQLFETSPLAHELSGTGETDSIAGSSKGYSTIGNQKFNFYQVHWHTPSENTIDGKSFPLEAHFVHQFDDPALHGTFHRLAVVGIMYELGECNEFLDQFWDTFPADKGISEYTGDAFDLNAKLSYELGLGYWHWYGSLTTPPCTESVSWNLLKKRETVCERQVEKLKEALRQTQAGVSVNNRVVQPLNHRVVVESNGNAPVSETTSTSPPPAGTPVIITNDDDSAVAKATLALVALIFVAVGAIVLMACMAFKQLHRSTLAGLSIKGVEKTPSQGSVTVANVDGAPVSTLTKRTIFGHWTSIALSTVCVAFVAAVLADGRSAIVLKSGPLPIVTNPEIVEADLKTLLGHPYGIGAHHDQYGRTWSTIGAGTTLTGAIDSLGADAVLAALPELIQANALSHPVPLLECNGLRMTGQSINALCFIAIITSALALAFHALALGQLLPSKFVRPVGVLLHFLLTVGFLVVVVLVSVLYTTAWECDNPVIPTLTLKDSFDLHYALPFACVGFTGALINLVISACLIQKPVMSSVGGYEV